jgi:hypothetical protein
MGCPYLFSGMGSIMRRMSMSNAILAKNPYIIIYILTTIIAYRLVVEAFEYVSNFRAMRKTCS